MKPVSTAFALLWRNGDTAASLHGDRRKPVDPALHSEEIYGIYDLSPARPYDMKEVIGRIIDSSAFDEYKPEYGKTIICGYARIGGFAVGIVANQKLHAQQTDHERP